MKTKVRQLTNVTVTLDEGTLENVRAEAAERKLSVSRFIGEVLRERRRYGREYHRAMLAALAQEPIELEGPYLKRDELYARPRDIR